MLAQRMLASAAAMTLAIAMATTPGPAQDYAAGSIKVSQVWTRTPPSGSKVAAGFMSITNTGKEADTLVGGTAAVAQRFEIHDMAMQDGVMRMRELKPGLVINPGETVLLKPGSLHVMLIDLTAAPETGKPFKGTLVFEKAGKIDIEYKVEPLTARGPGDAAQPAHGGGHGHGSHK